MRFCFTDKETYIQKVVIGPREFMKDLGHFCPHFPQWLLAVLRTLTHIFYHLKDLLWTKDSQIHISSRVLLQISNSYSTSACQTTLLECFTHTETQHVQIWIYNLLPKPSFLLVISDTTQVRNLKLDSFLLLLVPNQSSFFIIIIYFQKLS